MVRCEKVRPHTRHENTSHCPGGHGWRDTPPLPDPDGEFAVVIRRGPKCLQPDSKSLLPDSIFDTQEAAEKARDWYQSVLACHFREYVGTCTYEVVELRKVQ